MKITVVGCGYVGLSIAVLLSQKHDVIALDIDDKNVPQNIIKAIVDSNKTRKDFILDEIIKLNPGTVGIYRLNMKEGSDNCRDSASADIYTALESHGIKCIVYEPTMAGSMNLEEFKTRSDIIIANRNNKELSDVQGKVFTRDIFGEN